MEVVGFYVCAAINNQALMCHRIVINTNRTTVSFVEMLEFD